MEKLGCHMADLILTEHPHIVRTTANRAIIRGTRILVQTIVGYYKLGYRVEEILNGLPHLTPAQVYDALSYYHDHQAEIEAELSIAEDVDGLLEKYQLGMDERGQVVVNSDGG
jgi:uncharacterized protein (DUF433 family)